MTAQEELANVLADKIKQSIDDDLMADMMVACGWVKVKWDFFLNNRDAVDRKVWLEENCQGYHKTLGMHVIFEDSRDAVLFALRWG